MAEKTEIAWTDSTFNPWIGYTKVGPGCDHCYAEADFDLRKHRAKWGTGQPRSRTSAANWRPPLKWERRHAEFFAEHGRRQRVFCSSLADVFDNEVPDAWRDDLFRLIADTPNLDWLLLTKRIGNAHRMIERSVYRLHGSQTGWPWHNVWVGATVCNQAEADRDIPKLLMLPASMRFLSMEPLLGPVDISDWLDDGSNEMALAGTVDWVIVGGESGPHARPMATAWVDEVRRQCEGARVALFFKQWGGLGDKGGCLINGGEVKQWPAAAY